jgi:thioredoxin 2
MRALQAAGVVEQAVRTETGRLRQPDQGRLPLLVDVGGLVRAMQVVCAGVRAGRGAFTGVPAGQAGQRANQQLSAQLGIRSIPSLILFKNGREVARRGRFLPQLMSWLRSQGVTRSAHD